MLKHIRAAGFKYADFSFSGEYRARTIYPRIVSIISARSPRRRTSLASSSFRHIRGLHIQDNMQDSDTHLVPFLGMMNIDAVMNSPLDIGYDGYFTFEVGGFFTPANKRRKYERDTRLSA